MAAAHLHPHVTTSFGGQEWREQSKEKFDALYSKCWHRLHSNPPTIVAPTVTDATPCSCTGLAAPWILTPPGTSPMPTAAPASRHSSGCCPWAEGTYDSPEEDQYFEAWTISGIG
ncbi:Hypothetical predicted protein [Pelobates cultripes]|uniref:Uncharacterized protein n=1 Tax=Pelobates cultripes TaxID=61616 RepID=A0AAD1SBE6_PELCU|nr:Hypothetical predicted protein [Pelobates cultripes]